MNSTVRIVLEEFPIRSYHEDDCKYVDGPAAIYINVSIHRRQYI